ncbi:hypothetical protein GH714_039321 [Hevea brasiliensis]|uniref:MLO-like protein n=1 Tax=Hevea brasiliensis TaxID=3981 RepID=A0A6A6KLX1_HEVBR|nr:hypothetical protein GH714_039321 [Hevea brasiliensis]
MAAEAGSRSLEETPTWAVAVVCFVLVSISIFIEYIIHSIGKWLAKRKKRALYEALEKIKSELMLLGFISLLLTVGQGPITKICIPKSIGDTWHPCNKKQDSKLNNQRKLLSNSSSGSNGSDRRILAADGDNKCASKGKVPFVSAEGIHQLHRFIFVLALYHVIYCIITLALGRAKMRKWKKWEKETRTADYQFSHDPERFRFTRDTSFGRRHLNSWSHSSILLWVVCFFRQFFRSVLKVDYLTLRHGFIIAHLAPIVKLSLISTITSKDHLKKISKMWLESAQLCGYLRSLSYCLILMVNNSDTMQLCDPSSVCPGDTGSSTPSRSMSPAHLLRNYRCDPESVQTSPRMSNLFDTEAREMDSPQDRNHHCPELSSTYIPPVRNANRSQLQIEIETSDFSFDESGRK